MKSSRYSESQIRSLLDDQFSSGMSVQNYAKAKGIKPVTFYLWKRKFGETLHSKFAAVNTKSRFLPVRVSSLRQQTFESRNGIGKSVKLKMGKSVLVFGSQCSSAFVIEVLRGIL
jgi:transposase-like protein